MKSIKKMIGLFCSEGGAVRLACLSLIVVFALYMVACGTTTPTQGGLSGDWNIVFTVEPSGYTDPASATFSTDPGTGDFSGSITLTTAANDPGTFDVSGTVDGSSGAFAFSFAGTCAADDTDVTATLSGTVSGNTMSGDWTESASSGGYCEAGNGTFDGTSLASSHRSSAGNPHRAGETHSDRVFMRGVVPKHTR